MSVFPALRPVYFLVLAAITGTFLLAPLPAQSAPGHEEAPALSFHDSPNLPLIPGMTEIPFSPAEKKTAEKSPDPRTEWRAEGPVSKNRIQQFYRDTLPAAGWRPLGEDVYVRGSDLIRLFIEHTKHKNILHIRLRTAPLRP